MAAVVDEDIRFIRFNVIVERTAMVSGNTKQCLKFRLGNIGLKDDVKQDRYDDAETVFKEALKVFEKENSTKNKAEAMRGLAEVDLVKDNLGGAEKKLKEARDLLKEEHDFEDGYKIDMVMAKLLDKKGEQGKAVDVLEETIKKSSRQGYGFLVKRARDYLKSL